MRVITDFHLHSKWSRACSKDLLLPNIAKDCERKGIRFVGTGDALHPAWQSDIRTQLVEDGEGVFRLAEGDSPTRFMLSTEVASIYKAGGKVRRVHHLILFPSVPALERFTKALSDRGCNLKSDGRPILGIPSRDLLKMALDADPKCLFIPAHAWTPWFSVFGSKSGYDSLSECFGEEAKRVYAIETGLSSDPKMNWRWSGLDDVLLVSNSDAHSGENLGREANVFEMARPSYDELYRIFSERDRSKFVETIEFFPEEGKYHADGHRPCRFWCDPEESKRRGSLCPVCGRPLTIGVWHRVDDLADRAASAVEQRGRVPFRSIVPLAEVVGAAMGVGKASKKVKAEVAKLTADGRSEFYVLLDMPEAELARVAPPEIVSGILNMRAGRVDVLPGYDGEYGTIRPRADRAAQSSLL